jgi:demethylmenaquinone methyltransferase/2-methoxy-6-polyprenyl-1,4-benzoquinol methylase
MARVTRQGGTIGVLELGEPDSGALAALARLHVHVVVPAVGGLLSGRHEYAYLTRSIAAFPPSDVFCEVMEEAGLRHVSCERLTFGAVNLFLGRTGPPRAAAPDRRPDPSDLEAK